MVYDCLRFLLSVAVKNNFCRIKRMTIEFISKRNKQLLFFLLLKLNNRSKKGYKNF